jgi:hypothetical protein
VTEFIEYDDIFSIGDIRSELRVEEVIVPEWHGPRGNLARCHVRELPGNEFDLYQSAMFKIDGSDYELNMSENSLRLLAYCMCDKAGAPMFPNKERGIKQLGFLGQGGLDRVATVARRLNGLDKGSKKRAEGNSEETRSDSGLSDSRSDSDTPADEPSSTT